uniref:Integral membrane protein n=1 Tax=Streptomyces sp. NBC_00003 TaxID=2903608 RepID=A0AAU2V461_9ACTN
MPDRRHQLFAARQSSTPGSPHSTDPGNSGPQGTGSGTGAGPADDNPFAPPPEGRPDQPWQPRRPESGEGHDQQGSPWGSQWSDQQPGRAPGGFGQRPERPEGGPGQNPPPPPGLRWDPTDPSQRRARYALLSGMWAFFFALFDMPEVALLLGALGLYWAISSLRAKPKPPQAPSATSPAPAAPTAPPAPQGRPQMTAAVTGLVTAVLALTVVASTYTMQIVYRDYYTCVDDALTKSGQLACNDLLPEKLVPLFGVKE